jgi:formate hydrogenlyase subunit 4
MIHEVMVLDHSGPPFGVVLYASAVKLFVFAALVAHVMLPQLANRAANVAVSFAAILAIGVVIGAIESEMARLRLVRVPQLLITASLVAAFAVVLVLR